MKNNTLSFYNQVLDNLDKNIPPKSRTHVLQNYFQKYLPSFSYFYPEIVENFIQWNLTYTDVVWVFIDWVTNQRNRQIQRIYAFRKDDEKRYGTRSFTPTPTNLTRIPFEGELRRFREAFWPQRDAPSCRVSGTLSIRENITARMGSLWAW